MFYVLFKITIGFKEILKFYMLAVFLIYIYVGLILTVNCVLDWAICVVRGPTRDLELRPVFEVFFRAGMALLR